MRFSSFLLLLGVLSTGIAFSQETWELKRHEDGIMMFTRDVEDSKFKAGLNRVLALVRG